jgi:hypothetical protein
MYLQYKPSGTAIWVSLRKVDWYWTGDCHRTDTQNHWTLDSDPGSHSTNPASVDRTSEPEWSGNYTGLQYQPGQ